MNVCTELYVDDLELVWCRISPEFHKVYYYAALISPVTPITHAMDMFLSNVELTTSFNLAVIKLGDSNINCESHNCIGNALYNLCNLFDVELISMPARVMPVTWYS